MRIFLLLLALLVITLVAGGFWLLMRTPADSATAKQMTNSQPRTPSVENGKLDPITYQAGKKAYLANCAPCHQAHGRGIPGNFPPLAQSDYLLADPGRAIAIVLHGIKGDITVNGKNYNTFMPGLPHLDNQTVTDIVSYILNEWDNDGGIVTPAQVAEKRLTSAKPVTE